MPLGVAVENSAETAQELWQTILVVSQELEVAGHHGAHTLSELQLLA